MLKTLLLLSLIAVVTASCEKNGVQPSTTMNSSSISNSTKNANINEMMLDLKAVIPEDKFKQIDWNNPEITTLNDESIQIEVDNKNSTGSKLVYLITSTSKMYQFENEVHLLSPAFRKYN